MHTFCVEPHWTCPLWYYLKRSCKRIKRHVSIRALSFRGSLTQALQMGSMDEWTTQNFLACLFPPKSHHYLVHCSHAERVRLHTFIMKSKLFSLNCKAVDDRSPYFSSWFSLLMSTILHSSFQYLSCLLCSSLSHLTFHLLQLCIW